MMPKRFTVKITGEEGSNEWWEALDGMTDMQKCAAVADGIEAELGAWEVVESVPAMVEHAKVQS